MDFQDQEVNPPISTSESLLDENSEEMNEIMRILLETSGDTFTGETSDYETLDHAYCSEKVTHKPEDVKSTDEIQTAGKKTANIDAEDIQFALEKILCRYRKFNQVVTQAAEQCLDKVDQLAQRYTVLGLEECITVKSSSESVARDRWAKYHRLMTTGVPEVTALTRNHSLTVLLSSELFKRLNDKVTKAGTTTLDSKPDVLAPEESDISSYIGGSVIFKLKKRYTSARDIPQNDVLGTFIDESEPKQPFSFPSLTTVKSRGGLINLTEPGQTIFQQFEINFRQCYPEGCTELFSAILKEACYVDQIVMEAFPNTHLEVEKGVFEDMISLYFKIRSYSLLRNSMQKFYLKTRQGKRQKALRKTLKQ